jgi:hypothetical protein
MNTNAFRHLYDYHFAENRKIWDKYISSLTQEQFTKEMNYAQVKLLRGRNQRGESEARHWLSGDTGVTGISWIQVLFTREPGMLSLRSRLSSRRCTSTASSWALRDSIVEETDRASIIAQSTRARSVQKSLLVSSEGVSVLPRDGGHS